MGGKAMKQVHKCKTKIIPVCSGLRPQSPELGQKSDEIVNRTKSDQKRRNRTKSIVCSDILWRWVAGHGRWKSNEI
jgi:hypothetical protein